jgi:hypothetical protein
MGKSTSSGLKTIPGGALRTGRRHALEGPGKTRPLNLRLPPDLPGTDLDGDGVPDLIQSVVTWRNITPHSSSTVEMLAAFSGKPDAASGSRIHSSSPMELL